MTPSSTTKMLPIKFAVLLCSWCGYVCGFDLMILHASDINAEFEETPDEIGGFSRLLSYVQERRKQAENGEGPAVIVLMTGNFFGGSIWYSIHRWRIVSDFMNLLKPDAIALGTREFNDGLDELNQFLISLKIPIVGTNLVVNEHLPLKELIHKSVLLHVQGKRIVVLGYTGRGYLTTKNVDFTNVIQAVKDECDRITKKTDVDYVIAIGHANFQTDRKIALNSDCVHAVIGSNAKMFLYNGEPPSTEKPNGQYPAMVDLSDGSRIPVAHSYINGKYLGELVLTFNEQKELTKVAGNPVLLNKEVKQDPAGLSLLQKYTDNLEKKKRHIVGKTLTSLDGHSCNKSECTLGNLITDAFCDFKASQSSGLYWTNAAIGLINSGAIRSSQNISKQGKFINEAFLYKSLPYQEQLMTVRISGATLFKVLEHSMQMQGTSGFLQVSGLKIVYNETMDPPEMEVLVRCAKCEVPSYYPLNETMTYDVVTTKYLVEGGDNYYMLANKKVPYFTEIINSLQATMRYLHDYKKVIGQKEERIVIDVGKNSGIKVQSILAPLFLLMCIVCSCGFK